MGVFAFPLVALTATSVGTMAENIMPSASKDVMDKNQRLLKKLMTNYNIAESEIDRLAAEVATEMAQEE